MPAKRCSYATPGGRRCHAEALYYLAYHLDGHEHRVARCGAHNTVAHLPDGAVDVNTEFQSPGMFGDADAWKRGKREG